MRHWLVFVIVFGLIGVGVGHAQLDPAQLLPEKPMISPAAGAPGPDTWMFGQAYGNTTGAYNFGDRWYRAGQGLHFGIDLSMPCGTPLVAVADGTVAFVDDMGFGSAPHNLILRHDALGYHTLYGHLLQTPTLMPGQFVSQGQVIGLSGDPDETCDSRPHLHFEVRSMDFSETINPAAVIDLEWHSLALIGPYGFPLFQQNLFNPRQWMTMEDQPDVRFWGQILNQYQAAYPLPREQEPLPNTPNARSVPPLPADTQFVTREIGDSGCCHRPWWDESEPNTLYTIDGAPGNRAGVFLWDAEVGGMRSLIAPAPLPFDSPDGTVQVERFINGFALVRDTANGGEYQVNTGGRVPTVNANSTRLLWSTSENVVPGAQRPVTTITVSNLDGTEPRTIFAEPGAGALWLDADRVLLSQRDRRTTSLYIHDLTANTTQQIGTWYEMRGLSVAPGGGKIMFYLAWQTDPNANGVYLIDMDAPLSPRKMPWFGAWRFRDADSVYYIPYEPNSTYHTLRFYNFADGADVMLAGPNTAPFTIADGHWEVSADGRRIVFQDANTGNVTLLEQG